jgi:hypothetical protein
MAGLSADGRGRDCANNGNKRQQRDGQHRSGVRELRHAGQLNYSFNRPWTTSSSDIDPDHPGKFLKSAEPYSTSVTGIYSTKPGMVGRRQTGPKNPDEVPMAMIGIVPTKVSAENGPILPGDLLVTSSTIGYAMKGTDRNRMLGAVIGKALGNLASGNGVIEVVVTLQ